jgi:hypothetical protein
VPIHLPYTRLRPEALRGPGPTPPLSTTAAQSFATFRMI